MYKFNSENIFTGYIKQLLASFPLPKYKIYTKEQEIYRNNYLKNTSQDIATKKNNLEEEKAYLEGFIKCSNDEIEDITKLTGLTKDEAIARIDKINLELHCLKPELNVLETEYRNENLVYPNTLDDINKIEYPLRMRYFPYIKDGVIQEYVNGEWHNCHATLDTNHSKLHKPKANAYHIQYYNYGQAIPNYTKTLKIQNNVYDSYTHEYLGDYLRFHRDFANINLMPLYNCFSNRACPRLNIKFDLLTGQDDENNYIVEFNTEKHSDLFKYYMVPVKFFKDYTIAIDSEAAIEVCCCVFGQYQNENKKFEAVPKLTYQCFSDSQFNTPKLYSKIKNLNLLLDKNHNSELAQYEEDLKLILKIPVNNNSSIVILEGDYTAYTDSNIFHTSDKRKDKLVNHTVLNLEHMNKLDQLVDNLITPLQLFRMNTGESYPFADRLIEYLVGNVITVNETIEDNIIRAKKVLSQYCPDDIPGIDDSNGVWEPILQYLAYSYINKHQNKTDINHDILGFIDKDVEKACIANIEGKIDSISSINIYEEWEE